MSSPASCAECKSVEVVVIPRDEYVSLFVPAEYLKFVNNCFATEEWPRHGLQCFHEAFQSLPNGITVLDFGCGPALLSTISAGSKASEIVMADYCDPSLVALREWVKDEPAAFDWSRYFHYVVEELEGKDKSQTDLRQQTVRSAVKAIVSCDMKADIPIQGENYKQYDVVICSLVLEGTSTSHEEYGANIRKLGKMIKPGGSLLCYGVENKYGYYTVGGRRLPSYPICNKCWKNSFADAGFHDLQTRFAPSKDPKWQFRFISGRKE